MFVSSLVVVECLQRRSYTKHRPELPERRKSFTWTKYLSKLSKFIIDTFLILSWTTLAIRKSCKFPRWKIMHNKQLNEVSAKVFTASLMAVWCSDVISMLETILFYHLSTDNFIFLLFPDSVDSSATSRCKIYPNHRIVPTLCLNTFCTHSLAS